MTGIMRTVFDVFLTVLILPVVCVVAPWSGIPDALDLIEDSWRRIRKIA